MDENTYCLYCSKPINKKRVFCNKNCYKNYITKKWEDYKKEVYRNRKRNKRYHESVG